MNVKGKEFVNTLKYMCDTLNMHFKRFYFF